ncbi:MAG: L-serine ammonia-lyase [Deferribacterota bacterium]|nr:L-serine ammonia-lyase [Deferribacterota bacterium]
MKYINTSIFELFEIGPGPSSSHTIGPMKAALNFIGTLKGFSTNIKRKVHKIDVFLYGSLSSTGFGHCIHKAILAGLLGYLPSNVEAQFFKNLFSNLSESYNIYLAKKPIVFKFNNIHFKKTLYSSTYHNTLIFRAYTKEYKIFEREYYSIGGGFIKYKGEKTTVKNTPPHLFNNMKSLTDILNITKMNIPQIILENEMALLQLDKEKIYKKLKKIINVMFNSVNNGLKKEGYLPGTLKLQRKASHIFNNTLKERNNFTKNMGLINSYAFSVSEENADSEITVTAPTSGSCGVLPAIAYYNYKIKKIPLYKIYDGLLTAATIGLIIKENASLSGAEVGCQGEIGSASAMAASFLCQIYNKPHNIIENSAEIALEHHLGLTCDPIGGYVQIPCIERNAISAIKAYDAFIIASMQKPETHKLTLDGTIKTMHETGLDMLKKYKETSRGGLAVCYINC